MTITAATDCPMCGEVIPPGRNLYCSPRCRERAKKQRQRARAAGSDVPAPTPRRRRDVADELAQHLASRRGRQNVARRDELAAAQRETARLAGELAAQRRQAAKDRKDLSRERTARQGLERETRFLAVAFARTAAAHGLTEQVPPAIRARLSAWLPEKENPWH